MPVRRSDSMLHVLRDGPQEAVPDALLSGALHARDEAEAQTFTATFERGREGYARTRAGGVDDPGVRPGTEKLSTWGDADVEDAADAAGEQQGECCVLCVANHWPH